MGSWPVVLITVPTASIHGILVETELLGSHPNMILPSEHGFLPVSSWACNFLVNSSWVIEIFGRRNLLPQAYAKSSVSLTRLTKIAFCDFSWISVLTSLLLLWNNACILIYRPYIPFFSHTNAYDKWGFLQVDIMNEAGFDEQHEILKLGVTQVQN